MSKIKPIPEDELESFVDITRKAFPAMGINTKEEVRRYHERLLASYKDRDRTIYGLYRESRLLGGMILYDFTMNVFNTPIPVCGVGAVAVHLLHKKEYVAKEMLSFFLDYYREKDVSMAALYPFRPDFYKRMGFGYGTKKNQYRIDPAAIPSLKSKPNIRYLGTDDGDALISCYNRYASKVHGMIFASPRVINSYLSDPKRQVVGYLQDGKVRGYLVFNFDRLDQYPLQEMVIQEFIYETKGALQELLTFLHTQRDQVSRIVLNSFDDSLHFLLIDPRNDSNRIITPVTHETNTQGVGIMYRIIKLRKFFQLMGEHDFNRETCRMKIDVIDTFHPANSRELMVHFKDGHVRLNEDTYDVSIKADISDLTSVVMGVVTFKKLYEYNLVEISDSGYVDKISRIFRCDEPPVCLTFF